MTTAKNKCPFPRTPLRSLDDPERTMQQILGRCLLPTCAHCNKEREAVKRSFKE